MDSLTQFVLGAAVSTACLGRKLGPRKAALVGGVLGTVPDLDVFLPFSDPVDSFVYHRGWTHSVFVHALATPVFGELLVRTIKRAKDHRSLVYLTVFLCFSTHAIIDAMTVYGTRIFWPFYPDPVGAGSVFIIDPLYSLPLLAVVIWALAKKDWTQRLGRWTAGVLIATSGYLAASLGVQAYVEHRAAEIFGKNGSVPDKIYAIAAPFNIALWKVIGLDDDRYQNLYLSLFDDGQSVEIYVHNRRPELVSCLRSTDAYRKLDWFSRGYNRADLVDGKVVVSDLRMGLTPGYAFRFAIGEMTDAGIVAMEPERDLSLRRVGSDDFDWLGERLMGRPAVRSSEKEAQDAGLGSAIAGRTC